MGQTKGFGGASPEEASRAVLTLGQGQDPPESTWSPLLGGGEYVGTQLSSRPQASCLMESGERRPQAPASGHHGNEVWNATVLAFIPSTSGLSVLLLQGNAHRGRGGGESLEEHRHCPPFTIAFPGTKKPKQKNK